MRKDIEEPMSPVRNKNPRLGKKKISNGVNEGPEQIASDLAKVVRGDSASLRYLYRSFIF